MDDALTALLADDPDAGFERLVATHQDRVYALALAMTGSPPDAEEVAQDAFVRAHNALRGYSPERIAALHLRAWLHRIAVNVVRNRARVRRISSVPLDDAFAVAAAASEQPEAVVVRQCGEAELRALVASLPLAYREAVVLRHVQGLSYAEAADVLERPVGTVKANVHRGLGLLRLALTAREAG